MSWWAHLSWSHALLVWCLLCLAVGGLWWCAERLLHRQRHLRINHAYRCSITPHHSARRNGTQAVP
jgi:hypothetical protein